MAKEALTMLRFKPLPPVPVKAPLTRRLPAFAPGDDPVKAIFDRVLLHIRGRVPDLAHHPLHQLEPMFGDLRAEIAEIIDAR